MVNVKRVLSIVLVMSAISAAWAVNWVQYRSQEYGFQMLVPAGTTFSEREYGSGWGGLVANADGVMIYAVGKLGEQATVQEIESYGVRVTGISRDSWTVTDGGTNSNGWRWYKGVEARQGGQITYGGYGVGPKGSYLLIVKTTVADYNAHRSQYQTWFDSLTVF